MSNDKSTNDWRFWSTQPVPQTSDELKNVKIEGESIEGEKDVRSTPLPLPPTYQWAELDVYNEKEMNDLYELLADHYVEDHESLFRFRYSKNFLRWSLTPPGWSKKWHLAVRRKEGDKLVGVITGIPAKIRVYNDELHSSEINYLCVHKALRKMRLVPVLIREITRRLNIAGIFHSVYTAGVVLPTPVSKCTYWHRSINPKKLIEVKFSFVRPNLSMSQHIRLHKLPEEPKHNWSKFEKKEVEEVKILMNNKLKEMNLAAIYTEEEIEHWFLPIKDVIHSYVLKDNDGKITDFASYYFLPSTCVDNQKHDSIIAAYSFQQVANTLTMKELLQDVLTFAKNDGVDVFNVLDHGEFNETLLQELKFGRGDGALQYYLYNWRCAPIPKEKVGLILH
ncbi:hypothetical protein SNEBB_010326 [Seison nebaliae]|nr:hypothetical protein SNEBB_010326 [Seison nebaliae]